MKWRPRAERDGKRSPTNGSSRTIHVLRPIRTSMYISWWQEGATVWRRPARLCEALTCRRREPQASLATGRLPEAYLPEPKRRPSEFILWLFVRDRLPPQMRGPPRHLSATST